MPSVVFVCLGNICRSPLAEAAMNFVLKEKSDQNQWITDSCGTAAYHVGEPPDHRGLATMKKHGLHTSHLGRKLSEEDYEKFDYIMAMDEDNLRDIKARAPSGSKAKISLLGDYDPQGERIIEDPYCGDYDGFETVYEQCMRCCQEFYRQVSSS